jgi:hypothetical protein
MRLVIAILARSQLAEAASLQNQAGEFLPPQEQPRAERLKLVAHLLQGAMFQSRDRNGKSIMNEVVADVIEQHFVPIAKAHFAECTGQACDLVPEMRAKYQEARKGHLGIYADTHFPRLSRTARNSVGRQHKTRKAFAIYFAARKRCPVGSTC